jgi:hypothetical protein
MSGGLRFYQMHRLAGTVVYLVSLLGLYIAVESAMGVRTSRSGPLIWYVGMTLGVPLAGRVIADGPSGFAGTCSLGAGNCSRRISLIFRHPRCVIGYFGGHEAENSHRGGRTGDQRQHPVRPESEGLETVRVATGLSAVPVLDSGTVDLIILDIGLPDINGFDLREIRQSRKTPIILLTARTTEIDRVLGLKSALTTMSPSLSVLANWQPA